MNIWTGLLFLDGALSDVPLARSLTADEADRGRCESPAATPERRSPSPATQPALPAWRATPFVAIR